MAEVLDDLQYFVFDQVPQGDEPELSRRAMVGVPLPVVGLWHHEGGGRVDYHRVEQLGQNVVSFDVVTVVTGEMARSLKEHQHAGAAQAVENYHGERPMLNIDCRLGHLVTSEA